MTVQNFFTVIGLSFFLLLLPFTFPCDAESMPAPSSPSPPSITPGGGSSSSSSGSYQSGSSYGSSNSEHRFRAVFESSIKLTQSLWEGGATAAQIAMQKARLGTASYLLEDAANSLAFDAIASHIDVLRRRDMVQLAKDNVNSHKKILAMIQSRLKDGLVPVGDVYQIQTRLFRAQGSLEEYTSYLEATEASFLRITGTWPPAVLVPLTLPSSAYVSPEAVSVACQERNPRIKAALSEVKAYGSEIDLAKSRYYPQLKFETGPRWYNQDTPADSTNHGFDAMLIMQWNLYDGGSTSSAKRAAGAQKSQARQVLHRTMDTFAEDIQATWARYESAKRQADYYNQSKKAAKAASAAFQEEYLLGTRNLLNLLDAENDYFMATSQQMIAEGDRLIAAWRLKAIGGDLLASLAIDLAQLQRSDAIPETEKNNLTNFSWTMLPRE